MIKAFIRFCIVLCCWNHQIVLANQPLIDAVLEKDISQMQMLLESAVDPNSPGHNDNLALVAAVGLGYIEGVGLLLDYNADPNTMNYYEHTVLQMAIDNSDVEIVRLLLDVNVDIHFKKHRWSYSFDMGSYQ